MTLKIAVLMGGRSLEREVSLKSGHRVCEALAAKGYDYVSFDVDERMVDNLINARPDVVYIALHGKYGEDGTVQGLLELLGLPYTGPGIYANIVSFDKVLAKEIFRRHDIPTAPWLTMSAASFKEMGAATALDRAVELLGLPLVVKPARQGSALGIKIAHSPEDLPKALIGALSYDDKVILEQYLRGTELSVSILGNDPPVALPAVEIVTDKEFFDFEAMYRMGATDYFVPARLDESAAASVRDLALRVHRALGCRDVSRVDMILTEGVPYILELNTNPGMTETSLLPMAAAEADIQFSDLVEQLVQMALSRGAASDKTIS
jgi:D-alanine-D-alanine ligase